MADLAPPDSSSTVAVAPASARSRPTTLFPQPSIPLVPLTSSTADRHLDAPDAVAALAGVQGSDLDMEPSSSGHRRRRSSLMNSLDASAHAKSKRPHRSPGGGDRIPEEAKHGGGGDEEQSTSDNVELDAISDDEGLQDDEETGLTGKDKQRRKKRRRRNTLLDQRIAGDGHVTTEEKKEADKSVVKSILINVSLIGLWYLFSLSISIVRPLFPQLYVQQDTNALQYNKWMFDPEHLDFPFPLFTTCVHMIVQFCLSSLVLFFLPQFRPRGDSISNPQNAHSEADRIQQVEESTKPLMTKMFYLTRIGPCGLATGLDIGLGNMSLKLITLTFYSSFPSHSSRNWC